jgi:hypothetical protein
MTNQLFMKIKKYWKQLCIVLLSIIIGVLLVNMCQRQPVTDVNFQSRMDSLISKNKELVLMDKQKSDSIDVIVRKKEQTNERLAIDLKAITHKYAVLRNSSPDHDTIVKRDTLYAGLECIEKMPIIQAELTVANSIITDLKVKIVYKDETINILQKQFDSSIGINKDQQKELRKIQRKLKWSKVLNYGEAVIIAGAGVAMLTLIK